MHFDTALNIAWLLLGVGALVSTLCLTGQRSLRRHSEQCLAPKRRQMPQWLQLVGVASIVVALFPYISASDDVIRVANAQSQTEHQSSSPHTPVTDLLRLYEVSDAPIVSPVCSLAITFVFFALFVTTEKIVACRSTPKPSGRGPPSILLALAVRP